jgi:phosphotransferase system HPr (HPr) family protein
VSLPTSKQAAPAGRERLVKSVDVEIRNPSGLHARPAAYFVRAAGRFKSKVRVENLTRGSAAVDGKSILSFMGQGFLKGCSIRITADGEDEAEAIEALRDFVESGAGEKLETA